MGHEGEISESGEPHVNVMSSPRTYPLTQIRQYRKLVLKGSVVYLTDLPSGSLPSGQTSVK